MIYGLAWPILKKTPTALGGVFTTRKYEKFQVLKNLDNKGYVMRPFLILFPSVQGL